MTKDDLPPLPDGQFMYSAEAVREAQRAAIAVHDAKREKVLLWRANGKRIWIEQIENLGDGVGEYRWAYIEREGA
jgi:hypothetical protein